MTRGRIWMPGEVRLRQLPGSGICRLPKVPSSSFSSVGWWGAVELLALVSFHSAVWWRERERDAVSGNCQDLRETTLVLLTVNLPCPPVKSFESPGDRH